MEKQDKEEIIRQKKIADLSVIVEHCAAKIGLLRDFTSHSVPNDELFSNSGRTGFHHILMNLEDDLESVAHDLLQVRRRQIIEKQKVD